MKQNIVLRKLIIIDAVLQCDNLKTLKKLQEILVQEDEISGEEISAILRGLDDVKNGRTKPHSEVRKLYMKRLKKSNTK